MAPEPNLVCPVCHGPNDCVPARSGTFNGSCWCVEASFDSAAMNHLIADSRSCVCRKCANTVLSNKAER